MIDDLAGETVEFEAPMEPKKKDISGRRVKPSAPSTDGPGAWEKRSKVGGDKTELFQANNCVGWLLAIRGPNKGRSYEVFSGQNTVGRSRECAVCITADQAVSGVQCIVGYDPVSREYFICGSERSSAITRFNGKRLHGEAALEYGSIITLSDDTKLPDGKVIPGSVLRFIPACDDSFSWDMVTD